MCGQYKQINFLPSTIEEIWLFTVSGIPIIEFCKEKRIDNILIGGFISAAKSMCSEISGGSELNSILIDTWKYTSIPCCKSQVFIFCKSPASTKDKKIQKTCKAITMIFEDMFEPEVIKNWQGDIDVFDAFKNKLELYFKMSNL